VFRTCSLLLAASGIAFVLTADATIADESDSTLHQPIASADLVFAEIDGLVAVEAEHYFRQEKSTVRAWFRTTSKEQPEIDPDGDPPHVGGASGGTYLESLPDTRRTHADRLISGQNFSNEPGKLAILNYKVHFQNAGKYYVWVRAFSSGSEDNGLHVGLDGDWPESGQRLQWCPGKNTWRWDNRQRTQKEHCGVPLGIILNIDKPGEHVISFSMREDGFEFDKWLMTTNREFARPKGIGPQSNVHSGKQPATFPFVKSAPRNPDPLEPVAEPKTVAAPLVLPRHENGSGSVAISGELKQWHKVTLTLDGPFAHEKDNKPNPFTDNRMEVRFTHASGEPSYVVPGYFAADGDSGNSSAESGTQWKAHLSPDKPGQWSYTVSFVQGPNAALDQTDTSRKLAAYDGKQGTFEVATTDKTGSDFRSRGRLTYVGKRYLQFAGSKEYFLKAGADAPETLLGYIDFDNTVAGKPGKVPLKTWAPHVKDWKQGDPTWKDGKGKGLIGAVNYLSGKGCNAFSFLTYNAGGDGDNVWPFVSRNDKFHYDCSKLDQWGVVFDHGTARGMYLHFKLQETENDDHNRGKKGPARIPESLDGGELGPERKLYCRELIARFGHNLALNWNLGEENTQTTAQQRAMSQYIHDVDPYDHTIALHTYPDQQDKIYRPLLGKGSVVAGFSLQNSNIKDTHSQTVKWVTESAESGRPWIVAFDESGSAAHGQCPDLGYKGFDGKDRTGKFIYTPNEVRQQTLWGTLMAGGAGVEYYFGYQFVENDLICEDWRSRDRSWNYCRIALNFFRDNNIPIHQMDNADDLVDNTAHDNSRYCLAKPDAIYLVYLPDGGSHQLDLTKATGKFSIEWFNPRGGGPLSKGAVKRVSGGTQAELGEPPSDTHQDWLAVIRNAD
jgi:hypothetical protein